MPPPPTRCDRQALLPLLRCVLHRIHSWIRVHGRGRRGDRQTTAGGTQAVGACLVSWYRRKADWCLPGAEPRRMALDRQDTTAHGRGLVVRTPHACTAW